MLLPKPTLIEYYLLQLRSNSSSNSISISCPSLQSLLPSTLELHLLLGSKTRTTAATPLSPLSLSSLSTSTAQKTPIDYLIMNLGSCDDQYVRRCLDVFRRIHPNFTLLQYVFPINYIIEKYYDKIEWGSRRWKRSNNSSRNINRHDMNDVTAARTNIHIKAG